MKDGKSEKGVELDLGISKKLNKGGMAEHLQQIIRVNIYYYIPVDKLTSSSREAFIVFIDTLMYITTTTLYCI